MNGLNRCMILGALTADPELRGSEPGRSVLKFRLAANERYQDRDQKWQKRTEYVPIVVFGKQAEGLSRVLQKGDRLFVDGSLRTSEYKDREGVKRWKTEVIAREVILFGSPRPGAQRPPSAPPPSDANEDYGGDYGPDPF